MFSRKSIERLLRFFDVRRIYRRIRSSVISNPMLYIIISVYIIAMSAITILKHNTFLTSGFDLGLLNQAFSTALDGKLFYETGDLSFNPGGSFFGVHFSPVLFLLLPFYAIYPNVQNLIVMQTVILALGAFPVFWMSRDKLGKNAGLIVSILYFIYPPLFLLNLNDFHLEAFTSTFFLFSLYYFDKEKWKKFLVFFLLALGTLEFAPIIGVFMAFYGIWLLLRKKIKDKRGAIKYIAVAILVSILTFGTAIITKETINPNTSALPSAFHHILTDPMGVLEVISNNRDQKSLFAMTLFGPLAFVPLLAPESLIMAVPWVFASFSTSYSPYYSIYFQYTGFVIPFIFAALPTAIKRLKLQQTKRIFVLFFLTTIIVSVYITAAQEAPWNTALPIATPRTDMIDEFLTLIPSSASILTQNDIFPHVSDRAEAYMYIPNGSDIATDYILVDINSPWYDWRQPEQFGDREAPSGPAQRGLTNGDYGVFASAGSLLLLKKGYLGEPVLFYPLGEKFNYENLNINRDSGIGENYITTDLTSTSRQVIYHDASRNQTGAFWFGPYMHVLPGLYRVTYALKVHSNQKLDPTTILSVDVSAGGIGQDKIVPMQPIDASSIPAPGQWFNYTLFFAATVPIKGVEFRGEVYSNYSVSLDYVYVEQIVAQPISENAFYSDSLSIDQGIVSDGVVTHVKGGIMTHVEGSGTFWSGPYNVSLPRGNYTAKYWIRLDEEYEGVLLDLDVATNEGKDVIEFLTLSSSNFNATEVGKWKSFEIKFTLQNSKNTVEFRGVNVKDEAPISLLAIEVYPDTDQTTQLIFEEAFDYEDLLVEQGQFSDGVTPHLTHVTGNGTFWNGPYVSLDPGNYIAKYWLKLDKPYEGVLLDLDVATNGGKDQIKFLTLHGYNFKEVNEWQSFEIEFTLEESKILEFRGVWIRETAPISLLSIELYRDPGISQRPASRSVLYSEDLSVDQGIPVKNGTFWNGPYVSLDPGNYIAKYWLKLDEAYEGVLLNLDVTKNIMRTYVENTTSGFIKREVTIGYEVLTSLTVHSSNFREVNKWQLFEVRFTLQTNSTVEFRGVKVRERAPVSLLLVDYSPDTGQTTQPIPKTVFSSEELTVEQGTIANGTITHTEGNGTLWGGPYVSLPRGNYIAKYTLKLDKPYNGTLLDLDVATDPENPLAALTLSSSNFEEVGKWQSFEIKFTLQDYLNTVEFRGVNVNETAPISLRSIEVYSDTGQDTQTGYNAKFYHEYLSVEQGTIANGTITHTEGNGTLWVGPYVSLPRGNYIAKYTLKLDKPYNGTLLDLDVATNGGNDVLTSLTVHNSNFEGVDMWQSFEIIFTLDRGNILEFRGVNVRETAPISLRSIEVYSDTGQETQPIPKTVFSSEELTVEQGTIANGTITHTEGNGTLWGGPYVSLPRGNYIAKYTLKLDKPYNGTLLDLDVATNGGKDQIKFLTLHGYNFKEVNEWQSFEIEFTLEESKILEFRGVWIRETAPISLLSIDVRPDTGG